MRHGSFERFAQAVTGWAGQPLAFCLAFATVLAWAVTGPLFQFSETSQLVINTGTTIVTFLMVLLIQNAQNRDAAAMQAKLDEIVRAIDNARNDFIGIEHLDEKQIEKIREAVQRECGSGQGSASEGLGTLLERR